MSPKEGKIGMRIPEDLEKEIADALKDFEEFTGVRITKTNFLESAIREGIKVIRSKVGRTP